MLATSFSQAWPPRQAAVAWTACRRDDSRHDPCVQGAGGEPPEDPALPPASPTRGGAGASQDGPRVLAVHGNDEGCEELAALMADLGWHYEAAIGADRAWRALSDRSYDVVLLDLVSIRRPGLDLIARLRRSPPQSQQGAKLAILALGPARDARLRLDAFNLGADAVVSQPLHLAEVRAVLQALVRRRARGASVWSRGNLMTNVDAMTVQVDGRSVNLSLREFTLLRTLMAANGVVSRPALEAALGLEGVGGLDLCVHKLRRKIGRDAIETIRGSGYRLGSSFSLD